jgi:hypothetical protein
MSQKKIIVFLLLTLAVELALIAYTDPMNARRWTILMSLCQ